MKDIFEQIKEVEKNNIDYDGFSEEDKNAINPFMLLKWMSYTSDSNQVLHLNGLVNPKVFALYQHKALLYKLLVTAADGKHHYKWLKREGKNGSLVLRMISDANNCGLRDAKELLELHSKEELLDLCGDMNYDKIEADKIKKEINVFRV